MSNDFLSALRMERDTTFSVVRSGQRHLKKIDEAIGALTGSRCEFQQAMVEAGSQIVTSAETASKANNQLPKPLFEKLMRLLNSETPVSEYEDTELRNIMKVPYLTSRLRSKIKDAELEPIEPIKPMAEEPEVEQPEEPEAEQPEEPEAEQPEEPEVEQPEEPEVEQPEDPKVEQSEDPKVEQSEEPEVEQSEEPKTEQPEEPEAEQPEEPEVEQSEEPKAVKRPTPLDIPARQGSNSVAKPVTQPVSQATVNEQQPGWMPYSLLEWFMNLFKKLVVAGGDLTADQKRQIKGNHTLELAYRILVNGMEDFTNADRNYISKKPFLKELEELSKKAKAAKAVSSKEEPKSRSKRRSELTLSERFEKGDPTLTYEQICSLRRSGRINGAREEQYYFDLEESKKGSMLTEQQVESLEQYYSDLLKRFQQKDSTLTERQVEMLDKHYSGLLKRFEEKDRTLSKDQTQSAEQYCSYLLKRFQQKDSTLTKEQIQSLEKIGRVDQAQVEKYYASTDKLAAVS